MTQISPKYDQFLAVIAPHCGSFFAQEKAAWAFLGRLAQILGAAGAGELCVL